jgi:ABC-type glycerol-3-phosphate transport system substrate-binding protein
VSRREEELIEKLMRELDGGVTRRVFLQRASAFAVAASAGGLLAGCGGEEEPEGAAPGAEGEEEKLSGELTVWYLASGTDPEADKRSYQESARLFQRERGVQVKVVAQTLDNFITAWKSAVSAKEGPDLQYLWEGIFTLEDAWRNSLEPYSQHLAADETDHWLATASVTWDGELWNSPRALDGLALLYNTSLFERAGLDADAPLETWEDFTGACEKLKGAGITPLGFGLKDGFGGGWLYSAWARAHLENLADEMRAVIGEEDITDENHSEWWFRLAELKDNGYFNDDVGSVGLFDSLNLFPQQKVAMILSAMGGIRPLIEELGQEKVRVVTTLPTFGDGELAKKNVTIFSGGLVMAQFSENTEAASAFAAFLHAPERLTSQYEETSDLPADDRVDAALLDADWQKQQYENTKTNPGPWLEDWIPTQMDSEANFAGCQGIFAGEPPEKQVERTNDVLEKWRRENPDLVEAYTKWIEDAEGVYA